MKPTISKPFLSNLSVGSTEADDEYTDKYMFKFLGKFVGESRKKYVVEVKFTRDGTALDVTNPHLIVISGQKPLIWGSRAGAPKRQERPDLTDRMRRQTR
jgi:hypothetical protein